MKTGLSPKQINLIPQLKISNVNEKYRDKHGIVDDFYSKYDEGQIDDNTNDDTEHLDREQEGAVRDERTFNDNDDDHDDDAEADEEEEQEGTQQ